MGTKSPQAGEALLATEEGKAFMIGSSEDWGQAAIAAGEEPGQAEVAAKRTTAFFKCIQ